MLDFDKPAAEAKHIRFRSVSTYEEAHGRKETRDYAISGDVQWLRKEFPQWKTINSIGSTEMPHFKMLPKVQDASFRKCYRSYCSPLVQIRFD
jgi:hypothetical protein